MRWTFAEHVAPWHATVAPVQVQKRTPRVNWPQVDIFSLTNEDVAGSPQKSPWKNQNNKNDTNPKMDNLLVLNKEITILQ